MRRFAVILVACGLVLLAFTATASAKTKALPFQGHVVGDVVFTLDPGSTHPTHMWTDSSAVGDVSHLGATVMTGRHPTPTGVDIGGGHMKLVAANGDEVWIDYTGYAPYPVPGVPSTIVVDVAFTIVGGTGRFINASGGGEMTGSAAFAGVFDLGPWPAHWDWNAKISY